MSRHVTHQLLDKACVLEAQAVLYPEHASSLSEIKLMIIQLTKQSLSIKALRPTDELLQRHMRMQLATINTMLESIPSEEIAQPLRILIAEADRWIHQHPHNEEDTTSLQLVRLRLEEMA